MASASVMLIQPEGKLQYKVQKDINEDVCRRNQDLFAIKDWLKKQPHLPDEWEDSCLLNFLRGCNFSLEKTKRKLDMYFTMRSICPEFFSNRDINRPELSYLTKKVYGPTMPGLTPNGRRVTICKVDKCIEPYHLNDCFKIGLMLGDVKLREDTGDVAGEIYILDAYSLTANQIGKLPLTSLKKFIICAQEAYPIKIKEVHIINASSLVDTLFVLAKPFLNEKIKKRIYYHKNYTTLHEHIPKDMLPEEYGGTGDTLQNFHNMSLEKLKEYTDWFKTQESIKSNEAVRPGKPTNCDELFGIEGSFRKLSID